MAISLTKKELATVAGYTYRHLHNIDRDLPKEQKIFVEGEDGKYDLAIFVQKWLAYNIENETAKDKSLDEVRAIHERVKTRKTEMEVARMEGSLVDMNDIRQLWGDIANVVMQSMLYLPSKIAPMVVMMDNVEVIAAIIDREVRAVLDQIADTPVPTGTAQMDSRAEDDDG